MDKAINTKQISTYNQKIVKSKMDTMHVFIIVTIEGHYAFITQKQGDVLFCRPFLEKHVFFEWPLKACKRKNRER